MSRSAPIVAPPVRTAGAARDRARHLYYRARLQRLIGRERAAAQLCRRALEQCDYLRAYRLLGYLELPGEDYQRILARLHAHLKPSTYLEIGVDRGHSFELLPPTTRAIGIDPQPRLDRTLGPQQRLVQATSDEFFARHDVRAELGGSVRMAFIDGMHHFEYALRDFAHLESLADRDSVVLVHDCYPIDERSAARERRTAFWTGDVWRLVVLLKRHRPDLIVRTIATAPTGLALITGLDPASRTLGERLPELIAEGLTIEYSAIAQDKAQALNLFPNDWGRLRALLDAR
jgi:hypothetical protein